MLLSLLLAKKLKKIYPIAMIIIVGLTSFFSAFGLPKVTKFFSYFIKPISPVPLSYPFYAYVYSWGTARADGSSWIVESYSLDVLGIRIDSLMLLLSLMYLEDGFLYYSFFLLVNVIGAVVGYWISKASFLDKLFNRRNPFG